MGKANQASIAPEVNKYLAAVDLGSNSFHIIIATHGDSGLEVVERQRKRIQLAKYLGRDGALTLEGIRVGIDCLHEFAELLARYKPAHTRVVGTNTIRIANNQRTFIHQAEETLGCPVEVISGEEEARLVYQGAKFEDKAKTSSLIIDIGGGSTELIAGDGMEIRALQSLQVGCVSMNKRFFQKQPIQEAMDNTREHVKKLLACWKDSVPADSWQDCRGCSGTIRTVASTLKAKKWGKGEEVTAEGLKKVFDYCAKGKKLDKMLGVPDERSEVAPAGVAILAGLFDALGIDALQLSTGALREGLLQSLTQKTD